MMERESVSTAIRADPMERLQEGKYLSFQMGEEVFGLEILKVQEIIGMMHVTRVPRMPGFIRGVINLRGKIIPVIDLRLKFGLESREDTERTCIIVSQIARNDHQITMGILVDEVSEVLDIAANQLASAPDFGSAVDTDFILGMGKVGDKVVMLLDVEKVLTAGEIESVDQAAKREEDRAKEKESEEARAPKEDME